MAHDLLVNTSKTPIKHPVTGALIPGGHSYTVPDEKELRAQEKMVQAYEKAKAKEAAKAAAEDDKTKDGQQGSGDENQNGDDGTNGSEGGQDAKGNDPAGSDA